MADKKITDLQLRDNVSDDLNFPSDDGLQSYRVTAAQLKSYVVPDGSIDTAKLADSGVTLAKLAAALKVFLLPTGSIVPYAGSAAPDGFLLCDGSAVSRTTYAALFTVIGTTFGAGNGTTTFNLPNTQGVFLRGAGSQAISGTTYTGTLGTYQRDQFQGHWHYVKKYSAGEFFMGNDVAGSGGMNQGGSTGRSSSPDSERMRAQDLVNDGTNGDPRAGTQTHPANVGVNYLIKI